MWIYQAWGKKDLLWAVYSYFFWTTNEKTDLGFFWGLADLMEAARCRIKRRHDLPHSLECLFKIL